MTAGAKFSFVLDAINAGEKKIKKPEMYNNPSEWGNLILVGRPGGDWNFFWIFLALGFPIVLFLIRRRVKSINAEPLLEED